MSSVLYPHFEICWVKKAVTAAQLQTAVTKKYITEEEKALIESKEQQK
ncbi:hypothetical protein [Paenibacillus mucilaginosus]|uniref:XkdX family protein n=1 Tax=Paenibacillus mucilaginosus (strain KNP414) TaxID=1036673 RepID=F8FH93_PAEMK|nr:hypothetical protein [Paenibacillus mucilaginosus]AEI39795.1 hypothetical protein KNP414_01228 [Paenibacillus mucilaginosus KNP414]MCG7217349.1 hypothetical protein [Paenibacillus mucilaginosus]WDM29081.1 hypothetical protein KCX80_07910 [Paenibacillus mucilaginosus]